MQPMVFKLAGTIHSKFLSVLLTGCTTLFDENP
jgi:hypothetical protein